MRMSTLPPGVNRRALFLLSVAKRLTSEAVVRWPQALTRNKPANDADSPATQMSALRYAEQAMAARPQFLAYRVQDLTSPAPRLARNVLRMPLLTWTVRTAAERQRAAAYADQMIFEGFRPQ